MNQVNQAEPVKRITVQQAREKWDARTACIIDIRMPFDYAGGRVPGAMSMPNLSIRFRKQDVPADKELLFMSEDGGDRSIEACRLAASLGFKEVYNIEGGFAAWQAAGFPVETLTEGYAQGGSPLLNAKLPD